MYNIAQFAQKHIILLELCVLKLKLILKDYINMIKTQKQSKFLYTEIVNSEVRDCYICIKKYQYLNVFLFLDNYLINTYLKMVKVSF